MILLGLFGYVLVQFAAGAFGGARSAFASVVTGGLVWALGRFALDWTAPYITALISSTVAYTVVAQAEQRAAEG